MPPSSAPADSPSRLVAFARAVPLPVSGPALGVVSLGILLGNLGLPKHLATPLPYIGLAISVIFLSFLVLKCAIDRPGVRREITMPVPAAMVCTAPMAIMQIAGILHEVPGAIFLWWFGVGLHLALMVFFTAVILPRASWTDLLPSWLIVYVGPLVATVTAPAFGALGWPGVLGVGHAIFWFSAAATVVLVAALLVRVRKPKIQGPARPFLCIMPAPVALTLVAAYAAFPDLNRTLAIVIIVIAQIMFFWTLTLLPSIFRVLNADFYPSVGALGFPMVVCATAMNRFAIAHEFTGDPGDAVTALARAEAAIVTGLVLYMLVRYVQYFARVLRS